MASADWAACSAGSARPDRGAAPGDNVLDCLVIGGGPAGLTGAIYLARFHLEVAVIDKGRGRATSIPRTRNHAGFPDGIAGAELVDRMRAQAAKYGAAIRAGAVLALGRDADRIVARTDTGSIAARTVLLATGVINRRPDLPDALHDEALARGLLRYCPVCDGYEVTDTRIGVIGTGERGAREALFLRSYTRDVTLVAPAGPHALSAADVARLDEAGIARVDGPCGGFSIRGDRLRLVTPGGALAFDSVYPALGSDILSGLARDLGAEMTDEGCLTVDAHQRTSASGLYAAGDVVLGLDQISHAMGEGGVAATTIRNDLAEQRPLRR